jgi:hypothetical protein
VIWPGGQGGRGWDARPPLTLPEDMTSAGGVDFAYPVRHGNPSIAAGAASDEDVEHLQDMIGA